MACDASRVVSLVSNAIPFVLGFMATKEARNLDETIQKEEVRIGERKTLPYLFEKELIQKQAKHFWVVDEFIPIAVGHNINTLERKVSARHEQELPSRYQERFVRYTELSNRTTHYGLPLLESQVYGWLPRGFNYGDKALCELNFVQAPKFRCDMTIYGEKLTTETITERPGFNGLRFFLR